MSLLMEALRKAESMKRAGASEGEADLRKEPLPDGSTGPETGEEAGAPVGLDEQLPETESADAAHGCCALEDEPTAVTLEPLDEDSLLTLDLPEEAPGEAPGEVFDGSDDPPGVAAADASKTVAPPDEAGEGEEAGSRQAQEMAAGPTPERRDVPAESPEDTGGERQEMAATWAGEETRKKPEVETWRARSLALEPGPPGAATAPDESTPAERRSLESREENPSGNPEMVRFLMEAKKRNRRLNRLGMGLMLVGFLLVAAVAGWFYTRLQPQLEGLLQPPAGPLDAMAGEGSERTGPEDGNGLEQNRDPAMAAGAAGLNSPSGSEEDSGVSRSMVGEGSAVRSGNRPDAPPAGGSEAPSPAADRKLPAERASQAGGGVRPVTTLPAAAQAQPQARKDADVAAPRNAREAYDQAVAKQADENRSSARIEIRRGTKKKSSRGLVHQAWAAFRQGDHVRARRLYLSVVEKDPLNRDALLGLAALAVASGKNGKAQEYYLRLLERDPRDAAALAGMISLRGMNEVPEAISRIQNLIATNPDLGELHFILGNLYAAQSRWAYAQQAYFRAHALEPGHPDYAFNLAVSLDHLGKREQALDYYRRALEAARGHRKGFSEAAVRNRIAVLEGG